MKINRIYLRPNSQFSQQFNAWANAHGIVVEEYQEKVEDADNGIDGLVIFNENQEVDREVGEIKSIFDRKLKPIHNIDINGTLMVGISNLDLWIERNRCKNVLFIASDAILNNPNWERYLINIK
jgi:hypothetical protein